MQWGDPHADARAEDKDQAASDRQGAAHAEGGVHDPAQQGFAVHALAGRRRLRAASRVSPATSGRHAIRRKNEAWLTHCYGSVGVGRDVDSDSGGGTELYAVIGNAPRHLDRNITLVGRVVQGMELLSVLPRGTGALGFYEKAEQRVPIKSIRVAADVPAARTHEPRSAAHRHADVHRARRIASQSAATTGSRFRRDMSSCAMFRFRCAPSARRLRNRRFRLFALGLSFL